jgi:hypothetical protein
VADGRSPIIHREKNLTHGRIRVRPSTDSFPLIRINHRFLQATVSLRVPIPPEREGESRKSVRLHGNNQERGLDVGCVVANANTSHDEKNEAMEEILHFWQKTRQTTATYSIVRGHSGLNYGK